MPKISENYLKKDVDLKKLQNNLNKTMTRKVTIEASKLRTIVDKAIKNEGG